VGRPHFDSSFSRKKIFQGFLMIEKCKLVKIEGGG